MKSSEEILLDQFSKYINTRLDNGMNFGSYLSENKIDKRIRKIKVVLDRERQMKDISLVRNIINRRNMVNNRIFKINKLLNKTPTTPS
jgi:hypothetical protein